MQITHYELWVLAKNVIKMLNESNISMDAIRERAKELLRYCDEAERLADNE